MVINWKKLYGKHAASARQLWKCLQWDEKLYQKHKSLFEALAEYDKTGKLPEIKKKRYHNRPKRLKEALMDVKAPRSLVL